TLGDTVAIVLASLRKAFGAREVLLVLQEQPSGRLLLWQTSRTAANDSGLLPRQIAPARRDDYLFEVPGAAWHAGRALFRRWSVVAIDALGRRKRTQRLSLPAPFLAEPPCTRVIGAQLQLSDEWVGRILVLNPSLGVHREQSARFALQLARQIGP